MKLKWLYQLLQWRKRFCGDLAEIEQNASTAAASVSAHLCLQRQEQMEVKVDLGTFVTSLFSPLQPSLNKSASDVAEIDLSLIDLCKLRDVDWQCSDLSKQER